MIGAILGDIVGSIYEFDNIKTKDFELFGRDCIFTDDTIMTVAVADALMRFEDVTDENVEEFKKVLIKRMHYWGNKYPDASYGGRFIFWVLMRRTEPYNSLGNGSAMRVSPVGWYAKSVERARMLAKATAEVTHNHPEGIKGAVATAEVIFLARNGMDIPCIKIEMERYYSLNFTLDEIRPTYDFDATCQGTVPQAIQAFLEAEDFEDAIRNAISVGGDSDTLAAITGSVAEAYFGIPEDLKETALSYLDDEILDVVERFAEKVLQSNN